MSETSTKEEEEVWRTRKIPFHGLAGSGSAAQTGGGHFFFPPELHTDMNRLIDVLQRNVWHKTAVHRVLLAGWETSHRINGIEYHE